MAIWSSDNILLTTKGREVLSKVQSGNGKLTITKVKTSSGRVSESQLHSLTAVSIAKQTMEIAKSNSSENGSNLELRVSNTNLTESYAINQIGVYASHPDTGEILYMIAQCDEGTADIMPLPSETPATLYYDLYLLHSATQEVEITVDPLGYVSNATFDEHLTEFNNLKGSVNTLQETVLIQGEALRNNSEDISKNTEDISKNAEDISKNAEDISKNAEDISKNAEDILKNTEDISKNSESILKNAEDITDNTESISKNAEDIASIRSRVVKVESQTDTNKSNIDVVSGSVISLKDDVENINTYLGLDDDSEIYGVEVDYENNNYTRLGASVGMSPADFNNVAPWGGRRRCNVNDKGEVVAYYGDSNYTDTGFTKSGEPVQVMVEQPKFWYRTVPVKVEKQEGQEGLSLLKARYYISTVPKPGFKVFPLFTKGDPLMEVDRVYLSAYQGSLYDVLFTEYSFPTLIITSKSFGDDAPYIGANMSITINRKGSSSPGTTTNLSVNIGADSGAQKNTATITECIEKSLNKDNPNSVWRAITYDGNKVVFVHKTDLSIVAEIQASSTDIKFNIGTTSSLKGYRTNNTLIGSIEEGENSRLSSVSGVRPASGYTFNIQATGAPIREKLNLYKMCDNRNYSAYEDNPTRRFSPGFGWQLRDLSAHFCTVWLHLIEYATFLYDYSIGSLNNGGYENRTGYTSDLGNFSGHREYASYGNLEIGNSYRGEENFYFNGRLLTGGMLIKNEVYPMYNVNGIYEPTSEGNHLYTGFSLPSWGDSTITGKNYNRVGYSKHFDWGFVPSKANGYSTRAPYSFYGSAVGKYGTSTPIEYSLLLTSDSQSSSIMYEENSEPLNFWRSDSRETNTLTSGGRIMFVPEPLIYQD